jgi:signal transduction histidine kinase
MSHASVEQLRGIDLFEGLGEQELERWAQAAELREVEPGEPVTEQGALVLSFHLVLDGELEAFAVDEEGRMEPVSRHRAPTWVGAIAVLTGGLSGVRMLAATEVLLGEVDSDAFIELTLAQRPVFDRVMRQVRPVVSRVTALESNRERLASLGTMAAGLTHELNNPAAAARRAAADLAETLEVLSSTIGHFVEAGVEREQALALVQLQRQALAQCSARGSLDALDAADAEDELLAVLAQLGVPEAWKISEPLARAGVDGAWLTRVGELAGPAAHAALEWVAASLTAHTLTSELAESTERMSALVGAVKSYAYMDRGELVEVDLHEGLETTLTVLGHKLKHAQIEVVRDYDRSLPRMLVYGGELNQVWTNLIDNAIQAAGERGTITIRTALEGPCARVDVIDDGPGIAAEARERIFDPFFTTKEVGQGTGLGLDTARRIVVERHHGGIDVDSRPGETAFHVWLPLEEGLASASVSEQAQSR